MTSQSLLETLERSGLIADDVLAALRRQVAAAGSKLDAAAIVRQLIDQGHLTKAQGDRLIGAPPARPIHATVEVEPDEELELLDDDQATQPGFSGQAGRIPDDLEVLPDDEDDLLPPPPPPSPKKSPAPAPAPIKPAAPISISRKETRAADDDLNLAPIDEDPLMISPTRKPGRGGGGTSKKSTTEPSDKSAKRKRRMWRNEVAPAAPELANQVDDLLGGSGTESQVATAEGRPGKRAPVPRGQRNAWDSPLLLIGGGSLIGLLILLAVLLFVTRRQTGDQAFDVGEQLYKSGSYSAAIGAFDQYLEKFPTHGSVSAARVHRGMSEMRAASQGARDWTRALATAQTSLNQISPEVEFPIAQADLASVLPAIAEGLANQAHEKPSKQLIDQSREALALVDKYVPVTLQPSEKLREVLASLALTTRNLDRDNSLDKAIVEMQKASQAGQLLDVYAVRHKLLQTYPELVEDKKLVAAMLAAAESERNAVKFVAEERAPETTDGTALTLASVALTATSGNAAPTDDTDTVMVLDTGSAYAVDPRTGRPRWRRFVGYDTDVVPQVVKTAAGRAALLYDAVQQSVALIDGGTGKLRWRQPLDDGPPAPPIVVRDRVLVGGSSGKLRVIDLESGQLRGFVQIPQPLRVAPVVEPRERMYYQVAAQANMYVLTAESGECREVVYLGHELESIAAPPILVGRYLILAINSGIEDSVLRVLLADEEGLNIKQVEQVPLRGHVYSPPVVSNRALIVGTDRGGLYSFELGPPDGARILTKLAEKPTDSKQPIIPFLAARGSELWLGGYGLTRYDVQASRGALAPKWINDDTAVVLHPPTVVGPTVVYAARSQTTPGAAAYGINGADGNRFWETRLGVPLATPPIVTADANKALAMTAAGALFEVPAAGMASRKLLDSPVAATGERLSLEPDQPLVQLQDGRCVFTPARANASEGIEELLVYDPQASSEKLRRRKLTDVAATQPASYAGGVLVATKIGQVSVIDPDTGHSLLAPFQPIVETGRDVNWTPPTVYGDGQVLISDGGTKLYRLATVAAPRPHLEAAATVELTAPLLTAAAIAGDFAYVVDSGHHLSAYGLPDLRPGDDWALDARAIWGPKKVGENVWVATLSGQLTCVDGAGKMVWQVTLGPGNIVGSPLESRGAIVACSNSGTIYRVAPDTGKILSQADYGQPFALGPIRWHDRLLCAGSDGTLHIVAEPK